MKRLATACLILALIPAAAVAKDKKAGDPPPAVFQAVIDCRAIGDSGARLACYDAKVATLAEAQKSADLFVASKDDIRKARRGLFGHHVPHFHSAGWLSSAYYAALPPTMSEALPGSTAGHIQFGSPPAGLGLDLPARRIVRPEPGRLVLFPSYLWHGTLPFPGEGTRLTAAFDVVPGD